MDLKTISVKEFAELGILQELNRQFLHPLGLALSVETSDSGEWGFGPIWDYRDDLEGITFGGSVLNSESGRRKADYVASLRGSHEQRRIELFGSVIQPIPSLPLNGS